MRVIALRGNPLFAFLTLGDSQETMLDRAIRAQGN
ncbi:MAG: MAPEG family protein, partial [Halieaceae bacterium]